MHKRGPAKIAQFGFFEGPNFAEFWRYSIFMIIFPAKSGEKKVPLDIPLQNANAGPTFRGRTVPVLFARGARTNAVLPCPVKEFQEMGGTVPPFTWVVVTKSGKWCFWTFPSKTQMLGQRFVAGPYLLCSPGARGQTLFCHAL